MIRRITLVLVPVAVAAGAWLLLRNDDFEPVPSGRDASAARPPAADAAGSQTTSVPDAPAKAALAEATTVRSDAASSSDQRPIPADAKWLDVLVVDGPTQQPVPGAEVLWSTGSAHLQVQALPPKERQLFYSDQELIARRFGWHARSDALGIARVATDANGAMVHTYADGRYATGYIGGPRTAPPEGWRLELAKDLTLRAQVLDLAGRPSPGISVAIRMLGSDGKPKPGSGWIQSVRTQDPDGIAEFRHIQNWLRYGSRKPQFEVATWRVASDVPGFDDPGVEFDQAAPPGEPIVLHLPATGRLLARLLHAGRPFTERVSFSAFRGAADDNDMLNRTPRVEVGDDGWAHFPHVALGGSLTVVAQCGSAQIDGTTAGPSGNGQEVRVELTTEGLFALTGRLLGPDGKLLAQATATANIDAEVLMGGGSVTTDAQGRFLWVLTKGHIETPRLKKLVLTQTPAEGSPLRASVAPRDLVRGVNELGDIQLTHGTLVVAGRIVLDAPEVNPMHVMFQVEALGDGRDRDGQERWERLENLAPVQRPDGTFEVRGETRPVRHRLTFHAQSHLPVAPIEFQPGADNLTIPIAVGCSLTASCLPPDDLPANQIRGVLRPAGEAPPEPKQDRGMGGMPGGMGYDRYTARSWDPTTGAIELRWRALPAGTYTLDIRTAGLEAPLATIADVVLPSPAGGDPRLAGIDLRGKVHTLKVHVTRAAAEDERFGTETLVFAMPQGNPQQWEGLPVRDGVLVMPVPAGPIELLVASDGCQPRRIVGAEREVTVALEPWPTIELTFANLPTLPAGTTLRVSARDVNQGQAQDRNRRYRTDRGSGQLDSLLHPGGGAVEVKDGRAKVEVGDGTFRISAYLIAGGNRRPQSLRTITPREIQGGSNLAPIAVQLSADEIKAALETMQKAPAGK